MKTRFVLFTVCSAIVLFAAAASVFASPRQDGLWTEIRDDSLSLRPAARSVVPDQYRTFRLNKAVLDQLLNSAPEEGRRSAVPAEITLPMPDGSLQRFEFEHSLVVEPGLVAKYPELGATFSGRGIDDPTATVRFDYLPNGFHAIVLTSDGTVLVDPYAAGDTDNYVTYSKGDVARTSDFKCEVGESFVDNLIDQRLLEAERPDAPNVTSGTEMRTYRLALAGNWEYCNAVGGNTVSGCLAAMVNIMVRVNGVYERDLSMRMVMVANNDLIAYAGNNMGCPFGTGGTACTSANDPYSNSSSALGQNTAHLNLAIGAANYDIGHVFTTGSGGVANLNSPCGSNKGGGTTGLSSPFGDPFAIDYVAHEMGHQWGANHTFNSTSGGCGGNRSTTSAYEVGSGITIMGYAGLCGNNDLARNSIDTFHVRSLEAIVAFSQTGNGNSCAAITSTGNTAPTVTIEGGTTFDVPKGTPFSLTASATDPDGDTVTYDWQQYDRAASTTAVPNTDSDGSARPIFRPYLPTSSGTRYFPSRQFVLNNGGVPPSAYNCLGFTCMTGELLPAITRDMVFQVVVRDNRSNGGGFTTASATVKVDGNTGPFEITSQGSSATVNGNSVQNLTWAVNGTDAGPAGAANVKISFSTDGGVTFPHVISASTPNDGSESITIPNVNTAQGRIKIEGVGKIYFDISNANLTVNAITADPVMVSGRATSPSGLALSGLKITLIDAAGTRRVATTSSFGTYSFDNVASGQNYTMTATSKRYRFSPRTISPNGSALPNMDFVGLE